MSDSVGPHRRQSTRLPHPWNSPGKHTGVGCHFLLQCRKVKSESEVVQSCPTLSDPMDCSLPGSSVHRICQARVLEWGAIAFSDIYVYVYIFYMFIYLSTHRIYVYAYITFMICMMYEYVWTLFVDSGSWWWTGKPGVLQSMGLQRVGHNWVNWTDIFTWWKWHLIIIFFKK